MFDSIESFASVTKHLERLNLSGNTSQVMRRAVNALYTGRPGPSMVEIPADVALEEVSEEAFYWSGNVRRAASQADPDDVEAAARALCAATYPVIHAGQGVMYAEATDELVELAELLSAPVMTTLLGKSGFPGTAPPGVGQRFRRDVGHRVSLHAPLRRHLRRGFQLHQARYVHEPAGRQKP